jgi:uncharacterized protein (DUF1684 family)
MKNMSSDLKSLIAFRTELEHSLREPFSWLALAGLFWLQEGENTFGADAKHPIVLPADSGPQTAGTFILQDGSVRFESEPGVAATIDDHPVTNTIMKADVSGEPTYLHLGELRFVVIQRGGQLAIRMWYSQHPNRLNFKGRKWYQPKDEYKKVARINPYHPPKKVMVSDMIGNQIESEMHASLVFKHAGQEIALDAARSRDGRYFIIFKDATSGQTTYPSARFLISEELDDETVVIDFNKAFSPPCAFTDYATCPLPTPENVLSIPIAAGELYQKDH